VPNDEPETHSFIIKLWLEKEADGVGQSWRGHITHVPGANRRYLHSLEDILKFISPYLKSASRSAGRRTWRSIWFGWLRRRR
jgi:hypothetical protein